MGKWKNISSKSRITAQPSAKSQVNGHLKYLCKGYFHRSSQNMGYDAAITSIEGPETPIDVISTIKHGN
jgi:hypothetical protein